MSAGAEFQRQRRLRDGLAPPRPHVDRRTQLERTIALAPSSMRHARRALLCLEHGIRNTGRQWIRLRKRARRTPA